MIPVNSIEIPAYVQALCADWHSGQGCMLYAVCSSGGLTTGTIRPSGCDTPEKWYLRIWREFSVDIGRAAHEAANYYPYDEDSSHLSGDAELLEEVEKWADSVVADLERSYGLEGWDD